MFPHCLDFGGENSVILIYEKEKEKDLRIEECSTLQKKLAGISTTMLIFFIKFTYEHL